MSASTMTVRRNRRLPALLGTVLMATAWWVASIASTAHAGPKPPEPVPQSLNAQDMADRCLYQWLDIAADTDVTGLGTWAHTCQLRLAPGVRLRFAGAHLRSFDGGALTILGGNGSALEIDHSAFTLTGSFFAFGNSLVAPADDDTAFRDDMRVSVTDSSIQAPADIRLGASVCGRRGSVTVRHSSIVSPTEHLILASESRCGGSGGAVVVENSILGYGVIYLRTGADGTTVATDDLFLAPPHISGGRCLSKRNDPDVGCEPVPTS